MKARKYLNKIGVYVRTEKEDGFGGSIHTEPVLIGSSWCNITTLSPQKIVDLGLSDFRNAIQINLRKRNDLDYYQDDLYFKYNEIDYMIQSILEVNLNGYEIQIVATSI
ncbi:phage head-tail joining protein [Cellulophaga phage phi10:1]|uniref:Phage head-tail joining protein n=1 Tax=Cellulophaga phage phi10:1 TaxID=1327981 RepID=S0A1R0_9CAUD|nr:phage head-tail joining protein [Cellulophaga phage phi10:1]AGO48422.1 phage head-tail joining protein [Cellulophaga phage phi10:1]